MSNTSLPMEMLRLQNEGKNLTAGERRAIRLIAMGHSQVSAARQLGTSLETVKTQTRMARARLGAKTNAHAVAIALSLEMI